MIAEILVSKDTAKWKPVPRPDNDWGNWPDAGYMQKLYGGPPGWRTEYQAIVVPLSANTGLAAFYLVFSC